MSNKIKGIFNPLQVYSSVQNDELNQECLAKAKTQITSIWRYAELMSTYSNIFAVRNLILIGILLEIVEKRFLEMGMKKSDFMKWLRQNFEFKQLRSFQQARQLAVMGKFSRDYAGLGKNRLLELYRIRNITGKEFTKVLEDHPFPDTFEDNDGDLFKIHVDSIVTLYRFKKKQMIYVTFDHAEYIAAFLKSSISVKTVERLHSWLETIDENERPAMFDRFLSEKMTLPTGVRASRSEYSINKQLSSLNQICSKIDFEDANELLEVRQMLHRDFVLAAKENIERLLALITEQHNDENTQEEAA